jgi:hypothetical protein
LKTQDRRIPAAGGKQTWISNSLAKTDHRKFYKYDETTGAKFFLNDPSKLGNPFPYLKYYQRNKLILYYEPLHQWFVFGYDDVAHLFFAPRFSATWMKEFVYAAPEEVRQHLKRSRRFFKK